MGDYGSAVDWENDRQEIYALRNKLGAFEDNDWRSVNIDGNPDKEGMYEVTILEIATGDRYVVQDSFSLNSLFGFSCNKYDEIKVVAWKNIEPYMGD